MAVIMFGGGRLSDRLASFQEQTFVLILQKKIGFEWDRVVFLYSWLESTFNSH